MSTILLSQHSSNPFEATSSDTHYKRTVTAAGKRRLTESSEDELISGKQQEYWHHVSNLKPEIRDHQTKNYGRRSSLVTQSMTAPRQDMVDLDDSDESEDELAMAVNEEGSTSAKEGESDEDDAMDEDGDEFMDETNEDDDLGCSSSSDYNEALRGGKDEQECHEIELEMQELLQSIPDLNHDYKLVGRLGTGTFSSVYKAVDRHYRDWDNRPWIGKHPPESSAHFQSIPHTGKGAVYVAIKRIYVTSSPERIRNEITVMEDCRGCRHVSQLITAFRKEDQIVAIMPFQKNKEFRDFYASMPMASIKVYLRCLLRGLRDVHARGVIHRDLKPANFLYDPRTGRGTICDFGLASRVDLDTPSYSSVHRCLHTPASRKNPHGILRTRDQYDADHIKLMQRTARGKNVTPSENVGYPAHDPRPPAKANRAGTRGFRAPEVLLKCSDQSAAIDIWSVGVMLLLFLTRKFPLFNSSDDVEALMEIAAIVGLRRMEKVATLHSRTFSTNVPSVKEPMPWREFCSKQNEELEEPPEAMPHWYPHASESTSREEHLLDLTNAFDLLEKLMHPESIHRISARDALYHDFLAEDVGDDAFFPHPFGEGVCKDLHARDDNGALWVAKDFGDVRLMRYVESGEGIAIGDQPCEFHSD